MKKIKPQWEVARDEWLADLLKTASGDQVEFFRELLRSRHFEDFEAIKMVFGWRCPAAQKVWRSANKTGEKLGTHQAVEYLLRVVLGVPTDGSIEVNKLQKDTKREIQDLIVIGIEQGHVVSNSEGIRDAARAAVNDTFKKLGLKV